MKILLSILILFTSLSLIQASCIDNCDKQTPLEIAKLQSSDVFIKQIQFFNNGKYLAAAQGDKNLKIYETETQKLLHTFEHPQFVLAVAVSHDNKKIATAAWDKIIRIFDLDQQKVVQELKGHKDWVSSLEFSQNDQQLISASADQSLGIWNLEDGSVQYLKGHSDMIFTATQSSNGIIASGAMDSKIIIYKNNEKLHELEGHEGTITSLKFFGQNQQYLISGSWDKTIKIWDWENKTQLLSFSAHVQPVSSVDINDLYLVSSSEDKTVKVWDFKKIQNYLQNADQIPEKLSEDLLVQELPSHPNFVWNAKVSDKNIASSDEDGNIIFWDLKNIQCKQTCQSKKEDL